MRIDRRLLPVAAATLACMALCGLALASGAVAGALRPSDQQLLKLSTQGTLAEVELGRLAITHSANPEVQYLGIRLAQDGAKGVGNLQAVAAMLHMRLPVTPSTTQEGQLAKLNQLQGAAFDRQYERTAHEDESQMLQQFQSGVTTASNGAVKAIIEGMIPAVQEHLQIADGIAARVARVAKAPDVSAMR